MIASIRRTVPVLALVALFVVAVHSGSPRAQPDKTRLLTGRCSPAWSGASAIVVGRNETIARTPITCDTASIALSGRSRVTIRFMDGGPGAPMVASYSGESQGGLRSGTPIDGEVAFDVDRFTPPGADHPSSTRDGHCVLTFKSGEPVWIQCGAKVVEGGIVKAATVTFDVLPGQ